MDVLYDGGCAFCARIVGWLEWADVFHAFRFLDAQDTQRVSAALPQVRPEDTAEAMVCVTHSGRVLKGFHAFRYMIWRSPWLLPLVPIFYLPGAGLVGPRVYAWVARNRQRIGCRSEQCGRPPLDR